MFGCTQLPVQVVPSSQLSELCSRLCAGVRLGCPLRHTAAVSPPPVSALTVGVCRVQAAEQKRERVAKNELQRLRNIKRGLKVPTVGVTPKDVTKSSTAEVSGLFGSCLLSAAWQRAGR